VPESLKSVVKFLKCAEQHDTRDVVVAYFCRLCAFQKGYALDAHSPNSKAFLTKLMCKLEEMKASNAANEAFSSETVGLAHLEEHALKLFQFAYNRDMNADFTKATVQSFLTAGVLLDVATTLGQPTDELEKMRKYAKWKTLYITNCQKNGEVPIPGPAAASQDPELDIDFEQYLRSRMIRNYETYVWCASEVWNAIEPVLSRRTIGNCVDFKLPGGLPTAKTPQAPPVAHQPKPVVDPVAPAPSNPDTRSSVDNTNQIDSEVYVAVEKQIRFALSALQYQDKKSVVDNLNKALQLLSS
ncbi:vacuolar protein sorting-associated protein VTA1, partial [Clonorchis sinensis]